jgi:hypothetical protein
MSDTTGSASNNLTYGHHIHESHAFESPTRVEVVEDEKLPAASVAQSAEGSHNLNSSPSEPEEGPKPGPKREKQAPIILISWLRQAAAEIEAKKGNPNPEGTRHSNNRHRQTQVQSTSHTSSPYAMSEGSTGKLQQKDFTPEVDELLPQATALAQVESLPLVIVAFPSLTNIAS